MSSLPDVPLPPIAGKLDLLRESLRAIFLATRDPIANYREGVASRSRVTSSPLSTSVGWSPFTIFRALLPGVAAATSSASLALNLAARGKGKKPKGAPASPPQPAASPAPAVVMETPPSATPPPRPANVEGVEADELEEILGKEAGRPPHLAEDDEKNRRWNELRDLMASSIKSKKMSHSDFNRAVGLATHGKGTQGEKLTEGKKLLAFLAKRGVRVELVPPSSSLGAEKKPEKTFRDHVVSALREKKMSRKDFNAAVELRAGKKASAEAKKAIGEKVLALLTRKKIKVTE